MYAILCRGKPIGAMSRVRTALLLHQLHHSLIDALCGIQNTQLRHAPAHGGAAGGAGQNIPGGTIELIAAGLLLTDEAGAAVLSQDPGGE